MYGYVQNNPLALVDPTGLCSQAAPGDSFYDDDTHQKVFFPGPCADGQIGEGVVKQTVEGGKPPATYDACPFCQYFAQGNGASGPSNAKSPENPGQTGRSKSLNNVASVFGYDQNDKRPSCFGGFLVNTISNMVPVLPGISTAAEEGFGTMSRVRYNQAIGYAAHTASKTFGTPFLQYPFKSSVFRDILQSSKLLADAAPLIGVIVSEGQALFDEVQSIKKGECQ